MSDFKPFAAAIAAHFSDMSAGCMLARVDLSGDAVWEAYLAAFPEGSNPIYRVRTEHDGSYDRNFIRKLGNVVSIKNGVVKTIWDVVDLKYPYDVVCQKLSELVRSRPIVSAFRHNERKVGLISSTERQADGYIRTWNHFHAVVNEAHFADDVGSVLGEIATSVQMAKRGLEELKPEAFETVLSLISANNLYRGDEHRSSVYAFQQYQIAYNALPSEEARNVFLWENQLKAINRFRNTVIGTLLVDLSADVDLESAVRSFEHKVAPTNYKRTSALITPAMVNDAMKTIADLGLEPALGRRFATLSDVSVNNVLWVDASVRNVMRDGGIADLLMKAATTPAGQRDDAQEITIDEFMSTILPSAEGMEVLFLNSQQQHLMSLIAPIDSSAPNLLKWDNNFSWSYNGDITDSIRERVKTAGGNINAKLRVSLAWFNTDDLDLHAHCPDGHILFRNKQGILDVDMNAPSSTKTRTPVENLSWVRPRNGHYMIDVHQFQCRESSDVGFTLELAIGNQVQQFTYKAAVKHQEYIRVLEFTIANEQMYDLRVSDRLKNEGLSQPIWGVETEKFIKVNAVMFSPNYWDDNRTGNKHWFFILDKCANPTPTRGLYNEFLRSDLEKHRKVFEVLGDKMKCPAAVEQVSGLGFSSTMRETLTVKVKGPKGNRIYNVKF